MVLRPVPSLFQLNPGSTSTTRPVGLANPIVANATLKKSQPNTIWNDTASALPDSSGTIEENTLEEMSLTVGHSVKSYPHASSTIRLNAVPSRFMADDCYENDDGFESDPEAHEKSTRKPQTITVYNEAMDQSQRLEIDEDPSQIPASQLALHVTNGVDEIAYTGENVWESLD